MGNVHFYVSLCVSSGIMPYCFLTKSCEIGLCGFIVVRLFKETVVCA